MTHLPSSPTWDGADTRLAPRRLLLLLTLFAAFGWLVLDLHTGLPAL